MGPASMVGDATVPCYRPTAAGCVLWPAEAAALENMFRALTTNLVLIGPLKTA